MKTFSTLLVGLCFCSPLLNAQQEVKHAPTVEQCRADQRLWFSKIEAGNPSDPGDTLAASSFELRGWSDEMRDCRTVDPQFYWQYYNTSSEIESVMELRFLNFLIRHNLLNQFYAEEAQGKR